MRRNSVCGGSGGPWLWSRGCREPRFWGEGQVRGLHRALPTLCSTRVGGYEPLPCPQTLLIPGDVGVGTGIGKCAPRKGRTVSAAIQ